ncbi:pre-mRNA-splicing factor CWC25 [Cryptococcus sp. DSM 104548]
MGGGDLNMKKSWHPVLLVNQEKVWKAEKAANEERKKLADLRKEREEERQLEELHRLQEASTGKKRVEKLDWMYAAPGAEGGALGGARLGEKEMEEYLLGKKRVDEVIGQGDKNIGAASREFIAVQNANTARDTASKIREDPLLAIKRQEQAALAALMNRPDVRKQLREAKLKKEEKERRKGESKEERKARKKAEKQAEKEDRRRSKHRSHRDRDSRSPVSDYSDDRDRRHYRDSYDSRDRDDRRRSRDRPRSISPKREREYSDDRSADYRRRDDRRPRDQSPRRDGYRRDDRGERRGDDRDDRRWRDEPREARNDRVPPPRHPYPASVPSSRPPPPPQPAPSTINPQSQTLEDQRAARLAAMSASADQLYSDRSKVLANRAEQERLELAQEERMRQKYGQEQASAGFFKAQTGMGLSESLSRRAGKGLLKDI